MSRSGTVNEFGGKFKWSLDDAGTLTIDYSYDGFGTVSPYEISSTIPFAPKIDVKDAEVKKIVSYGRPTHCSFYNFSNAKIIDLSTFDVSKMTDLSHMFSGCTGVETIKLWTGSTSAITNVGGMFVGCSSLVNLNFGSNFNLSNVENASYMFSSCSSLTTLDFSNVNLSAEAMNYMFSDCTSLTSITFGTNFLTSKTKEATGLFAGCKSLTTLDLSNFDTTNVKEIGYFFISCDMLSSFTVGSKFNLSSLDKSHVIDNAYFAPCKSENAYCENDDAFYNLSSRSGTWTRNVKETYNVSANRSDNGTVSDDGDDITISVAWATNATTTDRTLKIYIKDESQSSFPSAPTTTATLSGKSGTRTLTVTNVGDSSKDLSVVFYDGTTSYYWYGSVDSASRLMVLSPDGDLSIKGNIVPGKILGIANLIYPVGSIYISMNSANPSTLFGGTWEQIKDRFLLSAGDSHSVGSTGGQTNMHIRNCGAEASGYGLTQAAGFANRVMVTDGNYTSDTNLPPYLTVYMWKRTA